MQVKILTPDYEGVPPEGRVGVGLVLVLRKGV